MKQLMTACAVARWRYYDCTAQAQSALNEILDEVS